MNDNPANAPGPDVGGRHNAAPGGMQQPMLTPFSWNWDRSPTGQIQVELYTIIGGPIILAFSDDELEAFLAGGQEKRTGIALAATVIPDLSNLQHR